MRCWSLSFLPRWASAFALALGFLRACDAFVARPWSLLPRGGGGQGGCSKSGGGGRLSMRFVTTESFRVKLGCEEVFEEAWRIRENSMERISGFERFMLLKLYAPPARNAEGEEELDPSKIAGFASYCAITEWAHALDSDEWVQKCGRESRLPLDINSMLLEPASEEGIVEYSSVIIEPTPPEEQGAPWDFEENFNYFDD